LSQENKLIRIYLRTSATPGIGVYPEGLGVKVCPKCWDGEEAWEWWRVVASLLQIILALYNILYWNLR